jgi:hypothetical protein
VVFFLQIYLSRWTRTRSLFNQQTTYCDIASRAKWKKHSSTARSGTWGLHKKNKIQQKYVWKSNDAVTEYLVEQVALRSLTPEVISRNTKCITSKSWCPEGKKNKCLLSWPWEWIYASFHSINARTYQGNYLLYM